MARHALNPFQRIRADHRAETAQDYVELIAELTAAHGEARASDVARRLGVSNPTVNKTLKRLAEGDLVTQQPYRAIFLTAAGKRLAAEGLRKHKMVEGFLAAIGVSAETARIDAEGIEHHVSGETLAAMARFLERGR